MHQWQHMMFMTNWNDCLMFCEMNLRDSVFSFKRRCGGNDGTIDITAMNNYILRVNLTKVTDFLNIVNVLFLGMFTLVLTLTANRFNILAPSVVSRKIWKDVSLFVALVSGATV
jgi:hypothetical protein